MAKTQTELTETEARERFTVLAAKAREFFLAVQAFQNEYDCDTVGLSEWTDDMDEVLCNIREDIDNTFESDEG
jgi:hypothetical protein